MRILLVHNFYRSQAIGGEDVAFNKEKEALENQLGKENVLIYSDTSDRVNFLTVFLNVFFSFRHFWGVYRSVKKNSIQLVHCHNFFPLISFSIFLAARLAGAKTVVTLHNYRLWCSTGIFFRNNQICHDCIGKSFGLPSVIHGCYHDSRSQSLITAIAFFLYRNVIGFSVIDKVVLLSEFQKSLLIDSKLLSEHKIIVKPHFIEVNTEHRPTHQIKEFDIVFIGKLEEAKGVYRLIEYIDRMGPECKWLIIGDGPLRNKIEELKYENVLYIKRLENAEVLSYIRKSRYLIQLSLMYETFGLTILEAMSVGVPVIAFPIGTRKELVLHGENGFLLKGDEVRVLENALKIETQDYELLSQNCLAFSDNFNLKKMIKLQVDFYKELLSTT